MDLQDHAAASCAGLADRLETIGPEGWDAPSACELWRVREVVAHLTMPARYDEVSFGALMAEHAGDFTALSNAVAARDGAVDPALLVADLRSSALAAWQPPGGGAIAALTHAVIHGADATVPLGVERASSDDAVRVVLDSLAGGGATQHFGVPLDGRRFEATDLDWSSGEGAPTRAAAAELVLLLSGRTV